MNCPECKATCCNNQAHDIRNGLSSFAYVFRRLKSGDSPKDYEARLDFELKRIDAAVKKCGQESKPTACEQLLRFLKSKIRIERRRTKRS
jgi:hypothetical protein